MLRVLRKLCLWAAVQVISCGCLCPGKAPAVPRPCPVPAEPKAPVVHPVDAPGLVILTPADAVAVGLYVRALKHRDDVESECLGAK